MIDAVPNAEGQAENLLGHADLQHAVPGHVERREKRVDTSIVGTVRLPDGTEFPCIIKDISQSGARLGIPGSCKLPDRFMFKMNHRDLIFQARLAWRRETYAGVRIERIGKLPTGHR